MDFKHIGIDIEDDILFLTIKKHKLFMHYGKVGMDAESLYLHLMFTGKMQHTNTVWAANEYLREGLGWTREKLAKAMNLLIDLSMCERIRRTNAKGQVEGWYIKVKMKQSPMEIDSIENHTPENLKVEKPEGGNLTTNALTKNINALTKKEKQTAQKAIFEDGYIKLPDFVKKKYQEAYPNIDIDIELKKMSVWLIANPSREKKNYDRFIVNWLSRIKVPAAPAKKSSYQDL